MTRLGELIGFMRVGSSNNYAAHWLNQSHLLRWLSKENIFIGATHIDTRKELISIGKFSGQERVMRSAGLRVQT